VYDCDVENEAPAGRLPGMSVTSPPGFVALTTKLTVDPARTVSVSGTDSMGPTARASQLLVDTVLLASPLYRASQLKLPAELKVWEVEFGTAPLRTLTGLPTLEAVPAQLEPGKYS